MSTTLELDRWASTLRNTPGGVALEEDDAMELSILLTQAANEICSVRAANNDALRMLEEARDRIRNINDHWPIECGAPVDVPAADELRVIFPHIEQFTCALLKDHDGEHRAVRRIA